MPPESHAERYILSIDMGSGSAKVALVSSSARVAAAALRPIRTCFLADGGAEQDPAEWWSAVVAASHDTLARAAVPPEQIIAVACTTQWAVTVPVDCDGAALGNAISWMDTRGGRYNRAITRGWPSVDGYSALKLYRWLRLTGGAPVNSGQDSLGHILFIKHERPELYDRTHKFLEPMDYLNLRLTGAAAASFGTIYPYWLADNRDANHVAYAPVLLALAGVDREKLPDLFPVSYVLGTVRPDVAAELGLSPATRVVMGTCDGHSAALGAGVVDDFDGYFYVGTTSWMSCHLPRRMSDSMHRLSSMPAALAGRYVVTAEQGMAGKCLEYLRDILYAPGAATADAYHEMNALAAEVAPGSDRLLFAPWLAGIMAPTEESAVRGAFFNQTARTTRGHLVRAVMEGIAYNLRWLRVYVEKFIGHRFERLAFIGGGATSDLWCQILADVLGVPVRQVANPRNANAVGAAMAAFVALGELEARRIPSLIKVARVYDPIEANRLLYDRLFAELMEFLKRTRPIYRRLNAPSADSTR
jgi:xylulokinase